MKKIILYIAASLDGYIARPDGAIDWLPIDQDYGYPQFLESISTVILGRKTYEQVLAFGEYPYLNQHNVILTHRSDISLPPNAEVWSDVSAERISSLREKSEKDIWLVGGSEVIRPFLELNAIDRLIVSICPILIGEGIPLFLPNSLQSRLKLANSQTFDSGLVQLTYDFIR